MNLTFKRIASNLNVSIATVQRANAKFEQTVWKPRCTFFWTSSARVHSDSRRSSPKVADSRRSSPTVAYPRPKSSRNEEKFANALWPTCVKCACEKLTFELSLDNDIKQPQDGPFGW